MKLFFYGGGHFDENRRLDKQLLRSLNKQDPTFCFLPSQSYGSEREFKEFVEQYSSFGVKKFLHFPIDIPISQSFKKEVFKSDLIHLGGGNTYYFLAYLRKKKLIPELKNFVLNGGVLTGLSAGGILMTPDIETASFPSFDRDDNEEGITNYESLSLVDFYFFPHYENQKKYDRELIQYSKRIDLPLYACPDGSGLEVDNNIIKSIGKTFVFLHGKKIKV